MRITVYGKPITQGSKIRTRWSMRDSNGDTLDPWRDNVRSMAIKVVEADTGFNTDPVNVNIYFTFPRPTAHFGTGRNKAFIKASAPPFPSSHAIGDIDKLARACLDALTDAGIWKDDSQVVLLTASKVWVGDHSGLDRPGAVINVTAANIAQRPVGAALRTGAREVAS
jgi:crossover junction endodeoxyribonuclease RusA